ncbi:MAG: hypothetical protein J7578_05700 [Chitinophagaceae bacterium]|nr:hypothetical protein [Chitinophagaceae bacterium]
MYTGLLHLHNLLRWVILVLILIAILRHLSGMNSKRPVNAGDKKIDLFLMISAHITLLIGLYQWFAGDFGLKMIQNAGMGEVMKNGAVRKLAIEHPVGMILAIVLITVGRGAVKRGTAPAVHKKAFWCFLIALIVILATIPWARPLFPGMH